jgi:hypothetical protein
VLITVPIMNKICNAIIVIFSAIILSAIAACNSGLNSGMYLLENSNPIFYGIELDMDSLKAKIYIKSQQEQVDDSLSFKQYYDARIQYLNNDLVLYDIHSDFYAKIKTIEILELNTAGFEISCNDLTEVIAGSARCTSGNGVLKFRLK